MRSRTIFYLFSVSLLFLTSCKKDKPSDPVTTITVDENGAVSVAADASGALYSIISREYLGPAGSSYGDSETAMAWFGSPTDLKDAGAVTVNANSIENMAMGTNVNVYISDGSRVFNGNNTAWYVAGSAANGIAGFSHTDITAFPTGGEFTLPATVDITKSLSIAHSPTTGMVVYAISGSNGHKIKIVQEAASNVTFTPAEMGAVAVSNDEIGVSIMRVVISPATTYNGKTYYFVKQFQHLRFTETQ